MQNYTSTVPVIADKKQSYKVHSLFFKDEDEMLFLHVGILQDIYSK
ncbi:hypothetical protein [Parafilimonas terrae]|nr:hypothetical protein [Parafilimonas terrae]